MSEISSRQRFVREQMSWDIKEPYLGPEARRGFVVGARLLS